MNLYGSVGEPVGDCCCESCPLFLLSSGGKSALLVKKKRLPVVSSSVYARGLKDQARQSKYPRT